MSARTNERTNERANACSYKIFPFLCKLYLANMCLESAQVSQILGGKIALGFCKCLPGSPFSLSLSLSPSLVILFSRGRPNNKQDPAGRGVCEFCEDPLTGDDTTLSLIQRALSHFGCSLSRFCKREEKIFADIQSVLDHRDIETLRRQLQKRNQKITLSEIAKDL